MSFYQRFILFPDKVSFSKLPDGKITSLEPVSIFTTYQTLPVSDHHSRPITPHVLTFRKWEHIDPADCHHREQTLLIYSPSIRYRAVSFINSSSARKVASSSPRHINKSGLHPTELRTVQETLHVPDNGTHAFCHVSSRIYKCRRRVICPIRMNRETTARYDNWHEIVPVNNISNKKIAFRIFFGEHNIILSQMIAPNRID